MNCGRLLEEIRAQGSMLRSADLKYAFAGCTKSRRSRRWRFIHRGANAPTVQCTISAGGEAEVRARGCPVSLRRGVDVVRGGHSLRRRKSARSLADTAPVANWSMTAVTQTMLKARPLPSQQRTQDATAAHDARCRLAMLGELPYVEALAGRRSATTTTR